MPDVDGGVLPVESTNQTVFSGDGIRTGRAREYAPDLGDGRGDAVSGRLNSCRETKKYKARTGRFGPFWGKDKASDSWMLARAPAAPA